MLRMCSGTWLKNKPVASFLLGLRERMSWSNDCRSCLGSAMKRLVRPWLLRRIVDSSFGKETATNTKRLQRTGISVSLIDNLPLAQLSPGRS
jgi:hypothetical protein